MLIEESLQIWQTFTHKELYLVLPLSQTSQTFHIIVNNLEFLHQFDKHAETELRWAVVGQRAGDEIHALHISAVCVVELDEHFEHFEHGQLPTL